MNLFLYGWIFRFGIYFCGMGCFFLVAFVRVCFVGLDLWCEAVFGLV